MQPVTCCPSQNCTHYCSAAAAYPSLWMRAVALLFPLVSSNAWAQSWPGVVFQRAQVTDSICSLCRSSAWSWESRYDSHRSRECGREAEEEGHEEAELLLLCRCSKLPGQPHPLLFWHGLFLCHTGTNCQTWVLPLG